MSTLSVKTADIVQIVRGNRILITRCLADANESGDPCDYERYLNAREEYPIRVRLEILKFIREQGLRIDIDRALQLAEAYVARKQMDPSIHAVQ